VDGGVALSVAELDAIGARHAPISRSTIILLVPDRETALFQPSRCRGGSRGSNYLEGL